MEGNHFQTSLSLSGVVPCKAGDMPKYSANSHGSVYITWSRLAEEALFLLG